MPRARGLTLIEVILASVLLVTLAGMITGALSFIVNEQRRELHRLNAVEVAHRVIAQYIDDPAALPDDSLPIQQGDFLYRFVMREELIELAEDGSTRERRVRTQLSRDVPALEQLGQMLRRVHVEVFLADPRLRESRTTLPVAQLERIYSPITGRDEDVVLQWITDLIERAGQEQRDERRERRDRNQR